MPDFVFSSAIVWFLMSFSALLGMVIAALLQMNRNHSD